MVAAGWPVVFAVAGELGFTLAGEVSMSLVVVAVGWPVVVLVGGETSVVLVGEESMSSVGVAVAAAVVVSSVGAWVVGRPEEVSAGGAVGVSVPPVGFVGDSSMVVALLSSSSRASKAAFFYRERRFRFISRAISSRPLRSR